MFIGFPPSSKNSFYHNEYLRRHFLVIALEVAKKLQWRIDRISETGFSASDIGTSGITRSKIEFSINDDVAEIVSQSTSGFIDFGRNRSNIRKFNDVLIDLKYDLKADELNRIWDDLSKEFSPKTNQDSSEKLTNEENDSESKISFLSIFIPRKDYLITPVLININIFLFILQIISGISIIQPDGESLLSWGGNFRPMTFNGQWWRLLTNCFLHIGILHMLMNMYALMYIGVILEPLIGSKRFGFAYILTGILASITSVCWHENTISAGASGAIFGMYGVFTALLTTNLIDRNLRKAQLTSIMIFILYNLVYGMKGGIDNAAHIGGLASGIIAGFTFYPMLKNPDLRIKSVVITISTILVFAFVSVFFISRTSDPIGEYQTILEQFGTLEQKALSVYRLQETAGDEKYLFEIENNGLPNWIKCKNLVDSAGRVEDLPENLVEHNSLLKQYCDYRLESYNLLKRAISENSFEYQSRIDQYNEKIDLIIRRLNGENIEETELVEEIEP